MLEEGDVGRPVPPEIDALARRRNQEQVQRTVADDLVGDVVSVEQRVLGLGDLCHGASLPPEMT